MGTGISFDCKCGKATENIIDDETLVKKIPRNKNE